MSWPSGSLICRATSAIVRNVFLAEGDEEVKVFLLLETGGHIMH